jgi:hypothetical protein
MTQARHPLLDAFRLICTGKSSNYIDVYQCHSESKMRRLLSSVLYTLQKFPNGNITIAFRGTHQ